MNLVGVQGLGGIGATPNVGDVNTCMPTDQYKALVDSNNHAIRQWSEAKKHRWYFLAGGMALGLVIGMMVKR